MPRMRPIMRTVCQEMRILKGKIDCAKHLVDTTLDSHYVL